MIIELDVPDNLYKRLRDDHKSICEKSDYDQNEYPFGVYMIEILNDSLMTEAENQKLKEDVIEAVKNSGKKGITVREIVDKVTKGEPIT